MLQQTDAKTSSRVKKPLLIDLLAQVSRDISLRNCSDEHQENTQINLGRQKLSKLLSKEEQKSIKYDSDGIPTMESVQQAFLKKDIFVGYRVVDGRTGTNVSFDVIKLSRPQKIFGKTDLEPLIPQNKFPTHFQQPWIGMIVAGELTKRQTVVGVTRENADGKSWTPMIFPENMNTISKELNIPAFSKQYIPALSNEWSSLILNPLVQNKYGEKAKEVSFKNKNLNKTYLGNHYIEAFSDWATIKHSTTGTVPLQALLKMPERNLQEYPYLLSIDIQK